MCSLHYQVFIRINKICVKNYSIYGKCKRRLNSKNFVAIVVVL